jgi:hypothetical protein
MLWLSWRQQRSEALVASLILAAIALLLIPTGFSVIHAFDDGGLAACVAHPQTGACDPAVSGFLQRFDRLGGLIDWFTMIPGILGVLLAAPLTLQLERGTYRLDWTQSITRGRWIAGKLAIAVGGAIVAAVLLIALITWWRAPLVRFQGRMDNSVFDGEGTVVVGYTLFALGLALAIGVVWRRAVLALIAGFAAYFASRLLVDTSLRTHFASVHQLTWAAGENGKEPTTLAHAWILSEFPTDKAGNPAAVPMPPGGLNCNPCKVESVAPYMHTTFHPASQFWQLQLTETAIFGGLAVLLIAFAAYWTHERVA